MLTYCKLIESHNSEEEKQINLQSLISKLLPHEVQIELKICMNFCGSAIQCCALFRIQIHNRIVTLTSCLNVSCYFRLIQVSLLASLLHLVTECLDSSDSLQDTAVACLQMLIKKFSISHRQRQLQAHKKVSFVFYLCVSVSVFHLIVTFVEACLGGCGQIPVLSLTG